MAILQILQTRTAAVRESSFYTCHDREAPRHFITFTAGARFREITEITLFLGKSDFSRCVLHSFEVGRIYNSLKIECNLFANL